MSDKPSNVIPWRPREQVEPRLRLERFRSEPDYVHTTPSPQLRVHASVPICQLVRGFHAAGLQFRTDEGTGDIFVFAVAPEISDD